LTLVPYDVHVVLMSALVNINDEQFTAERVILSVTVERLKYQLLTTN